MISIHSLSSVHVSDLQAAFPHVALLCDDYVKYKDMDLKSTQYRHKVLGIQKKLGYSYTDFLIGTSFILYSLGSVGSHLCRYFGIYSAQYSRNRIDQKFGDIGLELIGLDFQWYNGLILETVQGSEFNFGVIVGKNRFIETSYLLSLFGLGWFRRFMLGSGYLIRKDSSISGFDKMTAKMFDGLCDELKDIVNQIGLGFSELAGKLEGKGYIFPASSLTFNAGVKFDRLMKNMGEWTEEDFWDEMTELYGMVKSQQDIRQMRAILEMKAKAMGIMEDGDRGVNNYLIMINQQAKQALDTLGIERKEILELE